MSEGAFSNIARSCRSVIRLHAGAGELTRNVFLGKRVRLPEGKCGPAKPAHGYCSDQALRMFVMI